MTQAAVTATPETQVTAAQILDGAKPAEPMKEEATPPTPAAPEQVSSKLQVLMKREKTALERERSAKTKEAEIEARAQAMAAREAKIQEFESIKGSNPMKALELLGLSYQDLTAIALADGKVTPEIEIQRIKEQLATQVKTQEAALQRQEEEAKQAAEKQQAETLTSFKAEIATHLKENASRYELIAFEQCDELVFDVIDEHYERTKDPETGVGQVMGIAEAADKVESHLEKKYDKARDLSKVKAFLARKTETPSAKPQTQSSQKPKTLNNNLSATPQAPRTKPVTDEERIARAIAYARGLRP